MQRKEREQVSNIDTSNHTELLYKPEKKLTQADTRFDRSRFTVFKAENKKLSNWYNNMICFYHKINVKIISPFVCILKMCFLISSYKHTGDRLSLQSSQFFETKKTETKNRKLHYIDFSYNKNTFRMSSCDYPIHYLISFFYENVISYFHGFINI